MALRRVEIREQADGWRCGAAVYRSAVQALNACLLDAQREADESGSTDVLQIDWYPASRVGLLVVKSLTRDSGDRRERKRSANR